MTVCNKAATTLAAFLLSLVAARQHRKAERFGEVGNKVPALVFLKRAKVSLDIA